jgi:hypothetical protein
MPGIEERGNGPVDWAPALIRLEQMGPGQEANEYIDFLVRRILSLSPAPPAVAIQLLRLSSSPFTLQRAARALAVTAGPSDRESVDALLDAFKAKRDDGFLAPALLEAIGVLALKNSLARAELSTILLRLEHTDDRYLLIRAAKVIGWIEGALGHRELLGKLKELMQSDDLLVQAEVRQQLALVEFAEALLVGDRAMFRERVAAARAAFERAQASEEHRPDAAIFLCLLDMLLALLDPELTISRAAAEISTKGRELRSILNGEGPDGLRDYRSEDTTLLACQVLTVADALEKAVSNARRADDWLNIEEAVLNLAAVYGIIRWRMDSTSMLRRDAAMSAIAPMVLAPRLGPVLQRAVTRRKLNLVIEEHRRRGGEESILEALETLREHVMDDEGYVGAPPEELLLRLTAIATKVGRPPEELWRQMVAAIQEGRLPEWINEVGLDQPVLPIERPALYGADPNVDEVVRALLRKVADALGGYEPIKWDRLIQAVTAVVSFVKGARDRLPDYLRCSEDGGLGQMASEDNLKNDLFDALRRDFGRDAVYEGSRIAGGRSDSGLQFDECAFPMEAKNSFDSVEPSHIHDDYLPQADTYAAARDQVTFLLVLDLRASNAAAHRKIRGKGRTRRAQTPVYAAYSLRDSLWVDRLPTDPGVPHAMPNVLLVGLVPGNQCLPSSKSVYSERPTKARVAF